ncbi:hypothetical protein SAMN05660236_0609 [Ohtaekwangia koreensis]|uniref:Uncharacterized protein n=1 Tax=Ohtaekwangia koreensis TaxID=688867 RepID=A0A1T5J0Z6_9BACT|nr:hypothetical protein SAMN05660236_0609 [Ohtaekwangia koreensis]
MKDRNCYKKRKPPFARRPSNQKAVLKKVCYAYINKILHAFVTLYLDYFCSSILKALGDFDTEIS